MNIYFLILIVFVISFSVTWVVKLIAAKRSIIDIPNERSSHTVPTPRGGGLAIAIAWFTGITILYFNELIAKDIYFALMCGILVSGISILDDIYNLKALPRLAIQSIAAAAALYFMGGVQKIDFGFFIVENTYVLSCFSFIAIVGFINIYNFIDGIDGYAVMEALFVSIAAYILTGNILLLILVFAASGFLPWNWQKAKIFMGDVGSTLLGYTIAILAVYYNNSSQLNILIFVILTSLFWFDGIITIFRRVKNREILRQAHRKHAYQRIVQAGYSHQKTVLFAFVLNLFLFAIVYFTDKFPKYIIVGLVVNILLLYLVMKIIDKKKPF